MNHTHPVLAVALFAVAALLFVGALAVAVMAAAVARGPARHAVAALAGVTGGLAAVVAISGAVLW